MNAYKFFLEFHSGFRYIVVVLVLLAILVAFAGWLGKKEYTNGNRKLNLFAMISAHTQLLIGLVLYFLSPFVRFSGNVMKDPDARYWTVEHVAMMLFAIVLITIGHSKSKKAVVSAEKHRVIALFYLLAFITVIVAILQSHRPLFGMSH